MPIGVYKRTEYHNKINSLCRMVDPLIRYNNRIIINKDNNCWEWSGCLDGCGYGLIQINKKAIKVHRYAWTIYKGEIPNKLLVLHKCDNRKCSNPEHLFLGTNKDNTMDMINKNRSKNKVPEVRKKISDALKGKPKSNEARKNMKLAQSIKVNCFLCDFIGSKANLAKHLKKYHNKLYALAEVKSGTKPPTAE